MHTIFPAPKHKLIGHRGVAGLRPENTYCSFNLVAGLGLNWVEFDVLLTKDQQWVVMHDQDLSRTTNGKGSVRQHTMQQLSQLEAGLWFDPPYPGQKIPTLIGTLELAKQLELYCNVEIKDAEQDPDLHAKLMHEFLTQNAALAENRVMLSSFNLPCLIALRKMLPEIPIAYLIESFSADTIAITKQYNFNSINCDAKHIDLGSLEASKVAKIPVFLYTINDPTTAKYWLQKGVSAVFTDRPDLLR